MTVDIEVCPEAEESEEVVLGSVIGGRTGCRRPDTKVSLMRDVMRDVLPEPSSPQMHIRTVEAELDEISLVQRIGHTCSHFRLSSHEGISRLMSCRIKRKCKGSCLG